jgi:hypothetical protein
MGALAPPSYRDQMHPHSALDFQPPVVNRWINQRDNFELCELWLGTSTWTK